MKNVSRILYIFAVIGLGMLIGAAYTLVNTYKFLGEATASEGVVTNFVAKESNDSTTYTPVVRFVDSAGKEIEFSSSVSSNPPTYYVGEKVAVLYRPSDSHDAKINGFFLSGGSPLFWAYWAGYFFSSEFHPLSPTF